MCLKRAQHGLLVGTCAGSRKCQLRCKMPAPASRPRPRSASPISTWRPIASWARRAIAGSSSCCPARSGLRYRFDLASARALLRVQMANTLNDYSWNVSANGAFQGTHSRRVLAELRVDSTDGQGIFLEGNGVEAGGWSQFRNFNSPPELNAGAACFCGRCLAEMGQPIEGLPAAKVTLRKGEGEAHRVA